MSLNLIVLLCVCPFEFAYVVPCRLCVSVDQSGEEVYVVNQPSGIRDAAIQLLAEGQNKDEEVRDKADAALLRIAGIPRGRPAVAAGHVTAKHRQSCGGCKVSGLEKPLQVPKYIGFIRNLNS